MASDRDKASENGRYQPNKPGLGHIWFGLAVFAFAVLGSIVLGRPQWSSLVSALLGLGIALGVYALTRQAN